MPAFPVADEKVNSEDPRAEQLYQCCFCGETILPRPPDVCALVLHTAFQEGVSEETQTFFCHATCLKQRLIPSVPTMFEDR